MNPYQLFLPIFATFGVAVVAPAWMHFVDLQNVPIHVQFLASLILPLLVALILVSWLEPGG